MLISFCNLLDYDKSDIQKIYNNYFKKNKLFIINKYWKSQLFNFTKIDINNFIDKANDFCNIKQLLVFINQKIKLMNKLMIQDKSSCKKLNMCHKKHNKKHNKKYCINKKKIYEQIYDFIVFILILTISLLILYFCNKEFNKENVKESIIVLNKSPKISKKIIHKNKI